MQNKPDKIIVHHTAYGGNEKQFWKVNEWHKDRGFEKSENGIFVGYHVLIEKDGTATQARSYTEKGQHCAGQNETSIGVCMAGNFDSELPTEKQKEKLGEVCLACMKNFNIKITKILPHRAFVATACYGKNLSDQWAQYNVLNYQLGLARKFLSWIQIKLQK